MASNYTSQFGLCQWEADDPVKRTDFNEDNQKIEAGLLQLKAQNEESAIQLNAQIGTSSSQLNEKIDSNSNQLNAKIDSNSSQLNALIESSSSQLNAKIDSSFQQLKSQIDTQVEKRLAELEAQLPSVQGNLYDLLLNRYYSGENLSSRKMLFLDGFKDQSLIAAVTPGVCYDTSSKRPKVYAAGAQSTISTFSVDVGSVGNPGNDARYCKWVGSAGSALTATVAFTPSGYGTLRSVTMRMSKSATGTQDTVVQVKILDGSTVLAASQTVVVTSNTYADYSIPFPDGIFLAPRAYTLQVENVNQGYYLRVAYTALDSGKMGASCFYDPFNCSSGTLTGVQIDLGRDYTGALGWARHIGGAVDLAVIAGGIAVPLNRIAVQASATYKGEACTQSVFQLPALSGALSRWSTVQLTLHADSSGCILCDYGVSFF